MIELNNINGDSENSSEYFKDRDSTEKNKLIIINDSDYKHNKKSKIDFSTNYLSFSEEIKLMTIQKFLIYKNNYKVLLFILFSPLLFLTILHVFQILTDKFNESKTVKDHDLVEIDNINLNCKYNELGNYENDCISIGLAIIVYFIF